MDAREFDKLYQVLFDLAWNSGKNLDYAYHNIKLEDDYLMIATDLINKVNIRMWEGSTNHLVYHYKTVIKIQKARNKYFCTNNENHFIKPGDNYAIIHEYSSPRSWNEKMCRICAAKTIIILITNFLPIGTGGDFDYFPEIFIDKKQGNI